MTYSELATFATKLVEVGILVADNELVQPDLAVIAEHYGEIGVFGVVVLADSVSHVLKCMRRHLLSVRHGRSARCGIVVVVYANRCVGGGVWERRFGE